MSTYGGSKHGAVIIMNGKPVAVGINREKNSSGKLDCIDIGIPYHDLSVHAEIAALRSMGHHAKGGKMYIARWIDAKKTTSFSRPCKACYTAIVKAGIKEIIYTG